MVTFVSLFLGLVLGPQTVELSVQPGVASVELVLDGVLVERIDQPPWTTMIDFGPRLEPHRLEAVALDSEAREMDRAVQWLNLPRAPAEARFVLSLSQDGRGSQGHLIWGTVTAEDPTSVKLWFDGQALAVLDGGRFELPEYRPAQLHFLRAEVAFPENVVAVTEVTFGGRYAQEVNTDLTAVPVVADGARLPGVDELDDVVQIVGASAPVVAAEKGPAEVVLVRDLATEGPLNALRRNVSFGFSPVIAKSYGLFLAKEQWLRVFWTTPEVRVRDASKYVLFARSQDFAPDEGNFYFLLARSRWQRGPRSRQQIADAVAVAGSSAAERNRRRAVVLVIHDPFEDASQLTARQAREYLASLRVPLFVWTTKPKAWRNDDRGWQELTDVSTLQKLAAANRRLRKTLERQRILWVDGTHLPQEVALSATTDLEILQ